MCSSDLASLKPEQPELDRSNKEIGQILQKKKKMQISATFSRFRRISKFQRCLFFFFFFFFLGFRSLVLFQWPTLTLTWNRLNVTTYIIMQKYIQPWHVLWGWVESCCKTQFKIKFSIIYSHIRVYDSLSHGINGQNKTALNRQRFWRNHGVVGIQK